MSITEDRKRKTVTINGSSSKAGSGLDLLQGDAEVGIQDLLHARHCT